ATPTATAEPQAQATATPIAQPDPGPLATPAPTPTAPKISAAAFKRSNRTLTVTGTTTMAGKIKVELTYKVGKKSVKKTLTLAISGGKFGGTLKLSVTDAKKASKLTVTVSTTGAPAARRTVSVKK
ncbi:MAG TPA: hypothetical protein VI300_09795, partial [Solirubrobacter sp.]